MQLYIGKVTNNNSLTAPPTSPEIFGQTGAVQIFIEPLMSGFFPTQYHWFRPAQSGTGGSALHGTSMIPEKDSYVWCFYEDEDNYRKGFYLWNANLMVTNPHSLHSTSVQTVVGSESAYPDVKFIQLKNGVNISVSSSLTTPEITISHPTGSHIFIDKLGTQTLKTATASIVIDSTGAISIENTIGGKVNIDATGLIEIASVAQSMKTLIDSLIDTIAGLVTVAGGPLDPATIILLNAEKVKWATLLK